MIIGKCDCHRQRYSVGLVREICGSLLRSTRGREARLAKPANPLPDGWASVLSWLVAFRTSLTSPANASMRKPASSSTVFWAGSPIMPIADQREARYTFSLLPLGNVLVFPDFAHRRLAL